MKGMFLILTFCFAVENLVAEPVLIAGDASEIIVRRILTGQVLKTFKIKEYDGIRVVANYEEDVLFYSSDKKIYKIALLDDNGKPTVSGHGKLFTDPLADHMETYLYEMRYGVRGLAIDKARKKLIFSELYDIFEINFDGTGLQKIISANSAAQVQVVRNQLYFSDQATSNWKSPYGIYKVALGKQLVSCKVKGGQCKEIVAPEKDGIYSMMIERKVNKLFYRRGSNVIGVVDINLPEASYPVQKPTIVISDSQYVTGRGGIAVDGNRLVWNRVKSSRGQLLLGLMNTQLNFVSRKNIYLYGKEVYQFDPWQLDVFQQNFPTQPPTINPTTSGKCMCPCACTKSNYYLAKSL